MATPGLLGKRPTDTAGRTVTDEQPAKRRKTCRGFIEQWVPAAVKHTEAVLARLPHARDPSQLDIPENRGWDLDEREEWQAKADELLKEKLSRLKTGRSRTPRTPLAIFQDVAEEFTASADTVDYPLEYSPQEPTLPHCVALLAELAHILDAQIDPATE